MGPRISKAALAEIVGVPLRFLQKLLRFNRVRIRRGLIISTLSTVMAVAAGCGAGGGSTASTQSTPPPGPSGPTSTHSVTLTWTASSSPEVTGYFIYRRQVNNPTYALLNHSPTASLTYVDLDVHAAEHFAYVVTAVDARQNQSPPSEEVQVTVPQ